MHFRARASWVFGLQDDVGERANDSDDDLRHDEDP